MPFAGQVGVDAHRERGFGVGREAPPRPSKSSDTAPASSVRDDGHPEDLPNPGASWGTRCNPQDKRGVLSAPFPRSTATPGIPFSVLLACPHNGRLAVIASESKLARGSWLRSGR